MAENLPIDNMLMKYLDNEMTGIEKAEFEARLANNPDLKNQLESAQVALNAIRYYGINQQVAEVHQQLKTELPTLTAKPQPAKVVGMRKTFRYILAAAASIILIIAGIGGYWFYQLSADKVFNESYVAYTEPVSRSGANTEPAIENAYQQKDYNRVIALSNGTVLSAKQQLLVGLSYLQINNLQAAIMQFKNLINNTDANYKQDAEYYLSLTYLKNKEYNNALPIMKKIEADNNHLYHNQITQKTIREVEWLKLK